MAFSMIAFLAGCMSLSAGILALMMGLNLLRHFFKNKKIAGFFLTLSVFGWVGMAISATMIYWASEPSSLGLGIGGLEFAIISQKMVYIFVFFALMCMYLFGSKILFETKKVYTAFYLALGIILMILIFISDSVSSTDSFPDANYPLLTLEFEYSLLIIVYVIPTLLTIMIISMRLSRKVEEQMQKVRFKVIASGQLMILCSFIVDTLATVFLDEP
ncbi:MAG: hypothetical protein GY870_13960, partial [archaeon]|nr:hypothetical protein [archaeon]